MAKCTAFVTDVRGWGVGRGGALPAAELGGESKVTRPGPDPLSLLLFPGPEAILPLASLMRLGPNVKQLGYFGRT